ncbi:hypothetical protein [Clostridium sp.]|uniref:hypothetical protein n=1 Tax=Clostridium sp. TaxID=1506 RepID=UPI00261CDB23|nr:hypothetical protein [Clostridium sp.]
MDLFIAPEIKPNRINEFEVLKNKFMKECFSAYGIPEHLLIRNNQVKDKSHRYVEIECTVKESVFYGSDNVIETINKVLEKLTPIPIALEASEYALEVLRHSLPVDNSYGCSTLDGCSTLEYILGAEIIVYEGEDIAINQARVRYSNGTNKVIKVFELI